MKNLLSFIVVILFSGSLHSYEVKINEPRLMEHFAFESLATSEVNISNLPSPSKPVLIDKPFISFRCQAKLHASKLHKDSKGRTLISENKSLSMTKDLGRLQPNEEWFKNANQGSIDFDFKVKNKTLSFDLRIQGPDGEEARTDSTLFIALGYHKTYRGEGQKRTVASKEVSHIDLDADKTLPGGFNLSVDIGKYVIEDNILSLKVHCTDPKKEMRQVEVFIF